MATKNGKIGLRQKKKTALQVSWFCRNVQRAAKHPDGVLPAVVQVMVRQSSETAADFAPVVGGQQGWRSPQPPPPRARPVSPFLDYSELLWAAAYKKEAELAVQSGGEVSRSREDDGARWENTAWNIATDKREKNNNRITISHQLGFRMQAIARRGRWATASAAHWRPWNARDVWHRVCRPRKLWKKTDTFHWFLIFVHKTTNM